MNKSYFLIKNLNKKNYISKKNKIIFLLKKYNIDKIKLGISLRREFNFLKNLKNSNLTPKPIKINKFSLLIEWISGKQVNKKNWKNIIFIDILANIISKIHKQKLSGYQINLKKCYIRYWQIIDFSRCTPKLLKLHKNFLAHKQPKILYYAFLHMDLHPGNIIEKKDGSFILIDWEYSGDGDVALELAMLFCLNSISSLEQKKFINNYVKYIPILNIKKLTKQIYIWIPWVKYLILLWCEALWNQTKNIIFIQMSKKLKKYFNI